MSPFTRDGHLSDLGLERIAAGELAGDPAVDEHLGACLVCHRRLRALAADDALAPPLLRPRRARSPPPLWAVGAAVALAAGALVALRPAPEAPDLRPKGTGLALEVWRDAGAASEPLGWNDPVRPGDRLGFRARSESDGWVLVLGVDSAGSVYPCWPAEGGAAPLSPSAEPRDLGSAIRLDDTPGVERIVALRCPGAFGLPEVAAELVERASSAGPDERLPPLRAGCAQDEVRLPREAR